MKELEQWEDATTELVRYFSDRYFGKNIEFYFISNDISNVICIADYFFDVKEIVDFIRYKYTRKQMFEYYDYSLEVYTRNERPICIRDYKKLK